LTTSIARTYVVDCVPAIPFNTEGEAMEARRGSAGRGGAGALLLGLVLGVLPVTVQAQAVTGAGPSAGPITATIDTRQVGAPVDPLIYGYFIENLGSIFEGGLWAEMLGDRKFFHAVNADSVLTPTNSRSRFVGRWWPFGPDTRVAMDSARAFVGKHSPRVELEPGSTRGIVQPGIALSQGKEYTGRIVVATASRTPVAGTAVTGQAPTVEVSLVWGDGAADRQTVRLPATSPEYATFPLRFVSGGTTRDGRLEITGTGAGSLLVGAVSLMPADHVEGFRRDMIEVLRLVNPTTTRWGGNFSAGYEWRDGIGDPDRRPPRYCYAWNAVEQNDVGTLEVIALNRLLGAEPNIGVNSGLGDASSAAQWVEYVNGAPDTPMGRLRAEHGHPEPFGVKWWGIGNEMYGQWQLGHMAINHYVLQHNRFAEAMRAVDPSIILVASGATPFETGTTARHHRQPLPVVPPFEYDSPEDWSGQLLRHSAPYFEFLAEHIYPMPDQAFDAEAGVFRPVDDPLQDRLRRAPNRVRGAVEAWEEYHRRLPWLKDTGIRMVLDEWATGARGAGDMVGALGAAMVLNEMIRESDVWVMGAYTALTSVVAYDRTDALPALRASGLVFQLYTDHLGTLPLAVTGDSPQPELRGTLGVDKPRLSSGSPTYPLDILAALSADRRTLTVAVVNPSEQPQTLQLRFDGATPRRAGRVWTIESEPDARAMPGQPAARLVESRVTSPTAARTIAPTSIQLFEFTL
jgi:alpha-L-arabinofuranosidase